MADDIWIGGGAGSLNDPANWSQDSVPGPTTTAVFGAGAGLVEPLSGLLPFSASVVSVAAGVRLVVDGSESQSEFTIGTLDISNGATVDFNRSDVITQEINVGSSVSGAGSSAAQLDLGDSFILGDSVNGPASVMGPPAVGLGYAWSEAHGYGNVALSAIAGSVIIGQNGAVGLGSSTIAANVYAENISSSLPSSQVVSAGPYEQFFPPVSAASGIGNSDTLSWIGGKSTSSTDTLPGLDSSGNWFDVTTGTIATVAPGAENTVIFPTGHYVFTGYEGPTLGSVILQSDADVSLVFLGAPVPVTPHYDFGNLTLEPSSTLSTGGITSNTVDLQAGSTLDLYGSTGGPNPNSTNIVTLVNQGGSLDLPSDPIAMLGEVPPNSPTVQIPEFVEYSNGYLPDAAAKGIYSGESVIPSTSSLQINLGNVEQGSSIDPLTIGAYDPSSDNTPINIEIASVSGSGFTPNLISSAALQSGATSPLGSISVATGSLGTHTMLMTMTNSHLTVGGGQASGAPQTLEVTDNIIAPSADSGTPCFLDGTRINDDMGQWRFVEHLRPGDRVRTHAGRTAIVRWIGRRTIAVTEANAPICIRANAIGPGTPGRDVRLSPDHAVLIGDVLIPAYKLRNGATVFRDMDHDSITYWHVELDRHAILIADGLLAESYLDTGNRGQFDAEIGVRPLYQEPQADPLAAAVAAYAARGCARLCLDGSEVKAAHRRLLYRAKRLGWQMTSDPGLTVTADVPGSVRCAGDECAYLLPAGTSAVRIRSRCFVPAEIGAACQDGRRLGVAVVVRCDAVPLPAAAFGAGWYPPEDGVDWQWANGDARLLIPPRPEPCTLRIEVKACGARYWHAAPALTGEARQAVGGNARRHRA